MSHVFHFLLHILLSASVVFAGIIRVQNQNNYGDEPLKVRAGGVAKESRVELPAVLFSPDYADERDEQPDFDAIMDAVLREEAKEMGRRLQKKGVVLTKRVRPSPHQRMIVSLHGRLNFVPYRKKSMIA